MDCKIGYVYAHINKINGKAYVGQTVQEPEKRWGKNGKRYLEGYQPKFARAIQKYGWENFEHKILYKGCPALLDIIEKYYIKKYNSVENGYNLDSGGNINKKHSKETIEKIRISHLGKKLSKEHIEKIRISQLGRKHSKETKEKIRISQLGKNLSKETREKIRISHLRENLSKETKEKMRISKLGKKFSKETKEKIRISLLGNRNNSKKVRCIETGEIFESAIIAAKFINVNKHSVSKCCRGIIHTCGGYHWEYIK